MLSSAALALLATYACTDDDEDFFGDDPVLRASGVGGGDAGSALPVGGAGRSGASGSAAGTSGSVGFGGSAGSGFGGDGSAGGGVVDAGAPPEAGLPSRSTPSVNAGPDVESTVGASVALDGLSVSDPDGDVVLVSWNVVSAPDASVARVVQPDGGVARFVPDVAGVYTLHVTASDGVGNATDTLRVSVCENVVDAFPLPLSAASSIFSDLDDDSVEIDFSAGFEFRFFGVTHSSIHLNTNGGMTFGAGNEAADLGADEIGEPTIAPFWSDHDVRQTPGAGERADQLHYQQCPDRFVVRYDRFQEIEAPQTDDTATVTLSADGTIVIEYGQVQAGSILSGVFDGTHSDDRRPNPGGGAALIESSYDDYASAGSGIVLTDHFGVGPTHGGELSGRTITFNP